MADRLTIFFDLDGTLFSYNEGHTAGLQGAFTYWSELTGDSYNAFINKYQKSRKTVKRFLAGTVGSHSRALYFQGMVEENFKTSLPYHIAELTQLYWQSFIDNITPFPGVEETLTKLKEQGYQLAIITNMSSEIQFRKLHKLNLDNYFEAVITSEEVGQEKPHPHIYLHAVDRLNVKLSNCVMVGDDFNNDIEVAEFIGMKGILIAIEDDHLEIESQKITDFSQLFEITNKLKKEPLEGVIKYKLSHRNSNMNIDENEFNLLIELRDELWRLHLIGVYPHDHYLTPDVGFGNVSERYTKNGQFIISGSQTGDLEKTSVEQYALVMDYNIEENSLISKGLVEASSESLTHAAIYSFAPEVACVIHVHNKDMWENYKKLAMSTTPENVQYGTPEMAKAIQEVYLQKPVLESPICMLGHIEGLLTWGKTKKEALQLYQNAIMELEKIELQPINDPERIL
ncbi:MAG: putative HAD-hydrolase [Candidatus Heimdallarchaeota archaeon LC_2]|nr:MAG: putative HAD-hydrolase [Candidatus Heimdallarchaeota archaeon LC_2]